MGTAKTLLVVAFAGIWSAAAFTIPGMALRGITPALRSRRSVAHKGPVLSPTTLSMAADGAGKTAVFMGYGSFGSAMALVAGQNAVDTPECEFSKIWIYIRPGAKQITFEEEDWDMATLINEKRVNAKYLINGDGSIVPHKFAPTVQATSDLSEATKGAHAIVWATPHAYCDPLIESFNAVKDQCDKDCIAVSLVKGGIWLDEQNEVRFLSEKIKDETGMKCTVLMGANIAKDIARGAFAEATVGYDLGDEDAAEITKNLFNSEAFAIETIPNRRAVALAGSMKNVIALAAGFAQGLDMGPNGEAAVMRVGLKEERRLIEALSGADAKLMGQIVESSCGFPDLQATCVAGRNAKCAKAFAQERIKGGDLAGEALWTKLEDSMLRGQKLQGTGACKEFNLLIRGLGMEDQFPLILGIYKLAFDDMDATDEKSFKSALQKILVASGTLSEHIDEGRVKLVK